MSNCPIACICGSTRFKSQIAEANKMLTLEGYIVLAPGVFSHDGDSITSEQKTTLDAMHLKKVEMADLVFIVNPGGYVGASTWNEICHAKMLGKKTRFLAEISDKAVNDTYQRRLSYAERLAWESLDEIRHQGFAPPNETANPSIRLNGFTYFDPWVTAKAHLEAWSFHDDSRQSQDPFATFGQKKIAQFVAKILAGRGCPEEWVPAAKTDWSKHD